MSGYVLEEYARGDLEEIWDYIAKDNVEAADRWIGRLFDAFDSIATMPNSGHKREDLTTRTVLFWPVDAYVIVYNASISPVEILAITQGSRDISALLQRRLS